jgi:hypothetical protein
VKPFKMLGLAVVAALALSASTASFASAKAFQSTTYPVNVKGEKTGISDHFFGIGPTATIACKTVVYTAGPFSEAKEEIEVTPTYNNCSASGGLGAVVAMEGCKYRLNANTTKVNLVCPGTSKMRLVMTNGTTECEVQIASQNGLSKIEYMNNAGPPKTITVDAFVKGIKYKVTESKGLCPLKKGAEGEDGEYSGEVLAKGWDANEENQWGIYVE